LRRSSLSFAVVELLKRFSGLLAGRRRLPYTRPSVCGQPPDVGQHFGVQKSTCGSGGMADALASGASPGNRVEVRILSSAPHTGKVRFFGLSTAHERSCPPIAHHGSWLTTHHKLPETAHLKMASVVGEIIERGRYWKSGGSDGCAPPQPHNLQREVVPP
jgi:hypothetical protein